jgi:Rhodopirellula transposase DDE domain
MREYPALTEKFTALSPVLNEPARRLWAATAALALGRGGISAAARATGLSRPTIYTGMEEIHTGTVATPRGSNERVRGPGGGRQKRPMHDPTLRHDLEALVAPTTRGAPPSPLRWTCKSVRKLAAELQTQGHQVSPQLVSALLHAADYSVPGARKPHEGGQHPDRNAPFEPLNARVQDVQRRGQPVIAVDATKQARLGDGKHAGRAWHPAGHPPGVRVYDFVDEERGKAIPYGVYDVGATRGGVSVGVDHDTAACAGATIRAWWRQMGAALYPRAKELLITADGGGSNRIRARLWQVELPRLADETGLRIAVSHLPPGTSQWNQSEHRMCCHITAHWRGPPLLSREVIVSLMGSPRSATGLRIQAALEAGQSPIGIKVSAGEMEAMRRERSDFHGEWNYTILPPKRPSARRGVNT